MSTVFISTIRVDTTFRINAEYIGMKQHTKERIARIIDAAERAPNDYQRAHYNEFAARLMSASAGAHAREFRKYCGAPSPVAGHIREIANEAARVLHELESRS